MQRCRCRECGRTFSESQPLEDLRIPDDKAIQIVHLLTEGVGVRASGRPTGCDPHTVLAVLEIFGEKCAAFLDHRLCGLTVGSLQIDEKWSKVGVSRSRTTPDDQERGDFYTFLGLDPQTRLIVSHHTGKRDCENTDTFVADVASRIASRVQITKDGWASYPDTIRHHLLERLDYAVIQKNYDTPPAEIEASRRYSPAPFVGVTINVKAGAPRRDRICTSHIELANLSVRTFTGRFTRLCLGWSGKLANHGHAVAMFVAAHSFVKLHSTLGTTPAVAAGLADHPWTVTEFFWAVSEYRVT